MASEAHIFLLSENAEYKRMDTVDTGRDYKKYCCIFLTISACLGIYGFFNFQNEYTIYVDGRVVNFTGVDDFVPPFVSYYPNLFVAPEHKLISCGIPKSMSQLATSIMCLLYDEDSFTAENLSLNDTWATTSRKCSSEPEFQNPSPQLLNDSDTVRFAFIRDPIQRFVSFYLNKCVSFGGCFGCPDKNLRCFVRKTYEVLKNISDYRHGSKDVDVMAVHAAPLSWMCNFDKELEKWDLLMIGSDLEERKSSTLHLANILKRQGFKDSLVDKIKKDMMIGETPHGTHKSSHRQEAERQIREDPYIRDLLHKIYFFDYVVFPFRRDVLDEKYQTNFWKTPEV
ncbi:unnamed protein product [Caenorhabditis nigoni]